MLLNQTHAAELKNLMNAYVILGGDWMTARDKTTKDAEIIAVSVVRVSRKGTTYRIVTLADGSEALAVKYTGKDLRPVMRVR